MQNAQQFFNQQSHLCRELTQDSTPFCRHLWHEDSKQDIFIVWPSLDFAGCGFVQFRKWAQAEAALEAHNGKTKLGASEVPLVVKFADAKRKDVTMSHMSSLGMQHWMPDVKRMDPATAEFAYQVTCHPSSAIDSLASLLLCFVCCEWEPCQRFKGCVRLETHRGQNVSWWCEWSVNEHNCTGQIGLW